MSTVILETGVEVPRTGGRPARFKLRELGVGHSLFVQCISHDELLRTRAALSAAAQYVRKRHGYQFVIRTVDDLSVRCWRTA